MDIGIKTYDNGRVMVIYHQDPSMGDYIVDRGDIPEPEEREGYNPILYYTEENGFWYEYVESNDEMID